MLVLSIVPFWNVVSATGQSLQLAACHFRKQPQGLQVATNIERDSDWETSAIENPGQSRHANNRFAAFGQSAYGHIAVATRMGSGGNLKYMSWTPLRHTAGQR